MLTVKQSHCLLRIGKVVAVGENSVGDQPDAALHIPPNLLPVVVFGWKTLAELSSFYPDVHTSGYGATLSEVLFPLMDSYLYTCY